jgi:ribulose-phosphate 3-epimerase
VEYILPLADLVLLMTVNPGFGGQAFIPEVVPKIKAVKRMLGEQGLKAEIQVDGGINRDTAAAVVRAGANVLVAGSAIFDSGDIASAVHGIREAAATAG